MPGEVAELKVNESLTGVTAVPSTKPLSVPTEPVTVLIILGDEP